MNIKLYRSENQKNVIVEIATVKSKILLDCGVTLEENEVLLLPELQKEYSFEGIDGVFITNYNSDHVTMARGLIADAPTYIGRLAGKMAAAAESYKSKKPFPFAGFYANAVPIIAGDITVTPFLVDDAVHEGYLLFIQGEGTSVIYAGDYHANGRKRFEEMLAGLPTKVDVLLCKGGVITKDDINPITERGVEEKISELIAKEKG
ncbi:MAG: MBL fold metallo-hydrolase, partial [Oscillospiraceae bacterium]